jgi:dUTP pyrophosphatase
MWTINEDYHASIINFVKLSPSAQTPTSGSELAAGYDLHADLEGLDKIVIPPHTYKKISTGIAIALPQGTFGAIYPRSGMATKRGLVLANTVGIIDADYRGAVIVALKNDSDEMQVVEHGERIAQLIVQPFLRVEFNEAKSIGTTARADGGFGSSGNK